MPIKKLLTALLVLSSLALSQNQAKVNVAELPPEPLPIGTCKQDAIGYLGVTKNGKEETRLTDKQLGEYIRVRLSQGYSVSLYPQVSGKIFAIAKCETAKP